ncbi:MAG: hypothetical protein NC078_04745 [Ruminococcus sp.]|nr:hypothetical protein [Ruminococcus sp.]
MYADYEYYRKNYRGKLTEDEYTPLAEFAEAYINSQTDFLFEREGLPAESSSLFKRLKICVCALADEKHSIANGEGRAKTSETVGSYSVSYSTAEAKSDNRRLYDVLELYLPDVIKAVKWV